MLTPHVCHSFPLASVHRSNRLALKFAQGMRSDACAAGADALFKFLYENQGLYNVRMNKGICLWPFLCGTRIVSICVSVHGLCVCVSPSQISMYRCVFVCVSRSSLFPRMRLPGMMVFAIPLSASVKSYLLHLSLPRSSMHIPLTASKSHPRHVPVAFLLHKYLLPLLLMLLLSWSYPNPSFTCSCPSCDDRGPVRVLLLRSCSCFCPFFRVLFMFVPLMLMLMPVLLLILSVL